MDEQDREFFERLLQKYEEVLHDTSLTRAQRARFARMRESVASAMLPDPIHPTLSRRAGAIVLAFFVHYHPLAGPEFLPWLE
jgi:hypothetical protein